MGFSIDDFTKTDWASLEGHKIISYKQKGIGGFEVEISKQGMRLRGSMEDHISTEADLQRFAKFISDCWTEHRKLAPKLVTTLSGH